MDELRAYDPLSADWMAGALLGVLLLLAWTNVSSPRKWRLLVRSLFQERLGRQLMREEMDMQDRTLVGLLLGALCSMALFAYQGLWWEGLLEPGAGRYVRLVSIGAGIMVLQIVVARITATLAGADGGLSEFVHTSLLIYILLGLLLYPVVMLIAYQGSWRPALLVAGGVLAVLLLLYRWVRGLVIGLGEGVKPRYIFLYLCASEAVPLLLVLHQLRAATSGTAGV